MPYLLPSQPHMQLLMQFPVNLTAAGRCLTPISWAWGFFLQHRDSDVVSKHYPNSQESGQDPQLRTTQALAAQYELNFETWGSRGSHWFPAFLLVWCCCIHAQSFPWHAKAIDWRPHCSSKLLRFFTAQPNPGHSCKSLSSQNSWPLGPSGFFFFFFATDYFLHTGFPAFLPAHTTAAFCLVFSPAHLTLHHSFPFGTPLDPFKVNPWPGGTPHTSALGSWPILSKQSQSTISVWSVGHASLQGVEKNKPPQGLA